MDQAVKQPLHIDLLFCPEREPGKAFVGFDIREHGLNDAHALRIDISPFGRVDLLHHSFGICFGFGNVDDEKMTPRGAFFQVTGLHKAFRALVHVRPISTAQVPVDVLLTVIPQNLFRGTDETVLFYIKCKIRL
jgi:hypothetical protein